jgi:uncharacterized membrane protein YvlD (DUF360 family)
LNAYGTEVRWEPAKPRFDLLRLAIAWVIAAASVYIAAELVAGVTIDRPGAALLVAAVIAFINAVLPPLIAALRLPLTLLTGFILVLLADGWALLLADELFPDWISVSSFADALLASVLIAGVTIALEALAGTNDETVYALRVIERVARRQGGGEQTDVPGILFLEIDGLALPILRGAMRDGSAPNLARWIAEDGYRLSEWETDLSSQTGASQAGILLGSNDDVPAFRWVDKPTRRLVACSRTADPAEATCSPERRMR